jgi:hypothetical protein|tara:strand:+ start:1007 stop:1234 length:228 start_codon:yes stop_codon:yes gene_type:complete
MEDLIPVDGNKSLFRDPQTNAIINTNKSEYESYIMRRKMHTSEQERIESIEDDLGSIKSDIDEIKFLLRRLANGS